MFRLYIDVASLEEELQIDDENAILNIEYFKVYECSSKDGTYLFLTNVDYDPTTDYIEFVPSDETYWFKLSYVTSNENPIDITDEDISGSYPNFSDFLENIPVRKNSLIFKDGSTPLNIIENGLGGLTGDSITEGTINYDTGEVYLFLVNPPSGSILCDYTYWSDVVEEESELSEPVLGEDISKAILVVREEINDTNEENSAFTDDELLRKYRSAVKRFKGDAKITNIYEYDMLPITILIRISCCYDLAYINSKYTKLSLPDGIELNKGDRVKQYILVAKSLEKHYENLVNDLGGTANPEDLDDQVLAGTPSFEVIDMTKTSYFSETRYSAQQWVNRGIISKRIFGS